MALKYNKEIFIEFFYLDSTNTEKLKKTFEKIFKRNIKVFQNNESSIFEIKLLDKENNFPLKELLKIFKEFKVFLPSFVEYKKGKENV